MIFSRKLRFVALLFALLGAPIQAQSNARPPNFLFIAVDDLNDWVSPLGGHPDTITPNLETLAKRGTNFSKAYCPSPACSPSRNAILYGMEPYHTGLYAFYNDIKIHKQLKETYISLPRLLKENGYKTFGAGKIHHGFFQPDWEWDDYLQENPIEFDFDTSVGYQLQNKQKFSFCPVNNPMEELPDYQRASYAERILSAHHNKPFFLAVGIYRPHLPFICPKEFFDLHPDPVQIPPILENDLDDLPEVGRTMATVNFDQRLIDINYNLRFNQDDAWNEVRRAYLACISWADYNIGRVLSALEDSEHADNTIIILWSDNGYSLGEKEHFTKFALWEETTRTPFIIWDTRYNSDRSKSIIEEPVSLINIYRTVAEYAGLNPPANIDGYSLVPYLNKDAGALPTPAVTTWGRGNYAVRSNQLRYIRYFDGSEELYDLNADPNEWVNLANDDNYLAIKSSLAKHLPQQASPLHKGAEWWSIPLSADRPSNSKNAGNEL